MNKKSNSQDEQARSRKADSISDKEMIDNALKSESNKRDGSPDTQTPQTNQMKVEFQFRQPLGILFKNGERKVYEIIDFEQYKDKLILNLKGKDIVFDLEDIQNWGLLKLL